MIFVITTYRGFNYFSKKQLEKMKAWNVKQAVITKDWLDSRGNKSTMEYTTTTVEIQSLEQLAEIEAYFESSLSIRFAKSKDEVNSITFNNL